MERMTHENDSELREVHDYLLGAMGVNAGRMLYDEMEEMKNLMSEGLCHFVFTKVNGETREAYGTRSSDIIDRYYSAGTGKGGRHGRHTATTFPYFDIEKKDWRCFRIDSLLGIDRDYGI